MVALRAGAPSAHVTAAHTTAATVTASLCATTTDATGCRMYDLIATYPLGMLGASVAASSRERRATEAMHCFW